MHTLQKRLQDLHSDQPLAKERISREGVDCHEMPPKRPKWIQTVVLILKNTLEVKLPFKTYQQKQLVF